MKYKYKFWIQFVVVLFLASVLVSCSDDEVERPEKEVIADTELPAASKMTINTYFDGATIKEARKVSVPNIYNSIFSVSLSSKFEIDFDRNGIWTEIESEDNRSIPAKFLEIEVPGIYTYIQDNYVDFYVVEIEREKYGFTVELNNGIDLVFDKEEQFIGIDIDDDKDEIRIPFEELPEITRVFLTNHFSNTEAVTIKKDRDDRDVSYKVYLSTGVKIEFDAKGNWEEIESKRYTAIPLSFLPSRISGYIRQHFTDYILTEVEREDDGGYSLELYNKKLDSTIEVEFDQHGNFIELD
ncbi:PepSY-like domain-containing protein [Sphingobacterium sp. UT-1RO-CII-1]|uniref:PepSY-like domain-containing protein n=1 Tax=Sphingobacterium sp. UT-1RO-CII-1 TaxID=2995225 RepID=UPI00227A272F|nr:PepSY-like domain-containing protein [Sphingobacterium sp. UT-1RO-CII-1]MCY4781730.1 PepSY-like domain-containing protein [Sphingobacterium sp. UT-1RO-CII-1]